ncbi:glycosyltransferase family 2 protein [Sporohalobacter salinus]|uniref:glycosyltransferase family 2 protein n=1 Tax=Sporohalobacter salinus TaxID=1494606 RepID=UPI0019613592|nr:glycosyltransferase family 2 protein [Sporohalobacter salinus]MBM7623481.1 glycosyltransferase involved in cell wall biosynthesis [Sporohalobacter salinus]
MKIAAVIPAYNEEERIAEVVNITIQHDLITETIVVSDGSIDNTALIADECGAKVVELNENIGKGGAMQLGVEETEAEIILFLDADLIGLNSEHIDRLLNPLINNNFKMTVGLFGKGRFTTDLAQKIAPFLSGQRGVRREILQEISNLDLTRFGVEVALTRHAKESGIKIKRVILNGLTHVMKEEKLGLWQGIIARFRMYWEMIKGIQWS